VNTESTFEAVFDDLAERIGRIATEDMLVGVFGPERTWGSQRDSGRENNAIAGFLATAMTLDATRDFFGEDSFAAFVNELRTRVATYEERAA
jgi:hypothetical protein